ncbi:ChbG/HpnK family deacetylase [Burkholderiaceae bacterium UC74_6]
MSEQRLLTVCADDYGLCPGVNEAILDGVQAGWLTAVSCMSTAPAWREGAAPLVLAAEGRADLGLHLNLSEHFAAEPEGYGLRGLILRAYAGRLHRAEMRLRIALQLDAFEQATGRAPDFVDGHQHVHQLPVVREALIEELLRRYGTHRPWLRDTSPPADPRLDAAGSKHRLIAALGAGTLRRRAQAQGFAQNRGLVGVYGFDADEARYLRHLQAWLEDAQHRSLLMCHPGLGDLRGDPIAVARRREHSVLGSTDFQQTLQRSGFRASRMVAPVPQAN